MIIELACCVLEAAIVECNNTHVHNTDVSNQNESIHETRAMIICAT